MKKIKFHANGQITSDDEFMEEIKRSFRVLVANNIHADNFDWLNTAIEDIIRNERYETWEAAKSSALRKLRNSWDDAIDNEQEVWELSDAIQAVSSIG